MKHLLIFGATSAIAAAYTELEINSVESLFLVGRSKGKLDRLEKHYCAINPDLKIFLYVCDYSPESIITTFESIDKDSKSIDYLLVAHGNLPQQESIENHSELIASLINTNFTSTCIIVNEMVLRMTTTGKGNIAVISSVAGDRGRKSNYFYGSCKSGISTMLGGLQHKLANSNIHVLDIRPGFVDTPMTEDFPKGALWSKPEKIAKGIQKALKQKKYAVYLPWFWKYIMFIIKNTPGFLFRKTSL